VVLSVNQLVGLSLLKQKELLLKEPTAGCVHKLDFSLHRAVSSRRIVDRKTILRDSDFSIKAGRYAGIGTTSFTKIRRK
jgi:hypothetical protein